MYLTTEFYPQQDSDSNPSCGNSRFNSFERRILAFASAEVHCLFPVVVYMREIPSGTFSPLTLLNHSGVCGSLLFSCGFCRTPPSLIYLPVPSIFRVLSLRQEPYAAHVVLATSCVFTSRALRRTQCTRNPSRFYVEGLMRYAMYPQLLTSFLTLRALWRAQCTHNPSRFFLRRGPYGVRNVPTTPHVFSLRRKPYLV